MNNRDKACPTQVVPYHKVQQQLQPGNEAECHAAEWLMPMSPRRYCKGSDRESGNAPREPIRQRTGDRLGKHFGERAVVPTGAVRTTIEAFWSPKIFRYVRYNAELTRMGLDQLGCGNIEPQQVCYGFAGLS
jgi:hypothetical protein